MNRLFIFTLSLLASSTVWAECSAAQKAAAIELDVKYLPTVTKVGGNHGYMDQVIVQAPIELEGLSLSEMELTKGEVASFWIPVAYKVKGNIASSTISGYEEEIKNFEVAVYYGDSSCKRSIQRLLR